MMPKRKSDVPTTKSEIEVIQSVDACLTRQGFSRSGSKKKFVWRKGLIWSIFVSARVTEGVAHFEVWTYAPIPGLGSYLIYFFNRSQIDDIMMDVRGSAAGEAASGCLDDAVSQSQAVPDPQKKTVSGFAKAWLIFWIVANIGATLAPMSYLAQSSLAGIGAMVMLLSAVVVAGYFLLYYKNHIGLYVILLANIIGFFMNSVKVSNYSINVTTGLIISVITYFITRKQVVYPFGGPLAANRKL